MIRFRWRGTPVTVTPDFWGIGMLVMLIGLFRNTDWMIWMGAASMGLDVVNRLRTGALQRSWRERFSGKK